MRIGKLVDGAVEDDTLLYPGRVVKFFFFPLTKSLIIFPTVISGIPNDKQACAR